jgi:hypothetical protein
MNDLNEALRRLKRVEKLLIKPAYNNYGTIPPDEVISAAKAATVHTPHIHRKPRSIPVVGDLAHLQGSVYGKVLQWLNIRPVGAERINTGTCLIFSWFPNMFIQGTDPTEEIESFRRKVPDASVINDTYVDDDKAVIQAAFERVFGHSLQVDPRTHSGPAVKKSRANGKHDGAIVQCPIAEPDPAYVYQTVVNNAVPGDLVEDLRIHICDYRPVFGYMKYRPLAKRFGNGNTYARLASVFDLCSGEEVASITKFVRELGLEIGEIDALRDRTSGRLYIVDANNTPYGPPNNIEGRDGDLGIRWIADAFCRAYLDPEPE